MTHQTLGQWSVSTWSLHRWKSQPWWTLCHTAWPHSLEAWAVCSLSQPAHCCTHCWHTPQPRRVSVSMSSSSSSKQLLCICCYSKMPSCFFIYLYLLLMFSLKGWSLCLCLFCLQSDHLIKSLSFNLIGKLFTTPLPICTSFQLMAMTYQQSFFCGNN